MKTESQASKIYHMDSEGRSVTETIEIRTLGDTLGQKPGPPNQGKFLVIPKSRQGRRIPATSAKWSDIAKMIELTVSETENFSIFLWIDEVNSRRSELHRSPFGDLDQEFMTVVFQDFEGREVASIKFRGLSITSHECVLNTNSISPLSHKIMIQYDRAEAPKVKNTQDEPASPDVVSLELSADNEWLNQEKK